MITGNPGEGGTSIQGTASPNCAQIQICLVGGGGNIPSMPPCTAPDSVLGGGMSGPTGLFSDTVPPLQLRQCIYAFDTCSGLISRVLCVTGPAPAPVLSPRALALALAALALVALLGLARLGRDSARD